MRVVGLDIHRVFAEAVMLKDGTVQRLGRIGMTRDHLAAFAQTLTHDDAVVIEATECQRSRRSDPSACRAGGDRESASGQAHC